MRILMLAPGFSIHSTRPLNRLLEQGHEVIYVDGENPYPGGKERFLFIPYVNADDSFAVPMLREIRADLHPDLVHVHRVDRRAYQCMKAGFKPLILTAWGSDINNYFNPAGERQYLLEQELMAETLRNADLFIHDTPDIERKGALIAGRPIPSERFLLGVNTRLFKPGDEHEVTALREKLRITTDATVFVSIRAMSPVYNHHQILLAFWYARQSFDKDAVLVFRKYNNRDYLDYEASLLALIERLGLGPAVRWMEPCSFDQMPAVYALADYILNYPIRDAFPVTFLEAAACGRPVITNRLPAYEHTFVERFFEMVEPGNVRALAQPLVRAVNGAKKKAEIKAKQQTLAEARNAMLTHYDESKAADQLVEIYRRLITPNPHPSGGRKPLAEARWQRYLEKGLSGLDLSTVTTDLEMYQLGSVFKQLGHEDKAETCFRHVINASAKTKYLAGAWFHLGDIYYRQGRMADARTMVTRCLALSPEHRAAIAIRTAIEGQ
ncbi:MAG: glycosyltransferase [Candidatus Omnitrophota bacterium]